jgi:nicotinamidase-related amidase
MQHPNILELSRSALLIIDMQEAFRHNIKDFEKCAERTAIAVQAASLLNIPTFVTEQYPKGLGDTAKEIFDVLAEDVSIIEKTAFSSCAAQACQAGLQATQATHILVAGLEAHICVNQTVHDLLAQNLKVHLLTDCITSRNKKDRKIGLEKMQQSGAIPSSVEMALFELIRDARHEQFKTIQGLIK